MQHCVTPDSTVSWRRNTQHDSTVLQHSDSTEYCCHVAATLDELAQAQPPPLSGNPCVPGTVAIRVGQGLILEDAQQQLSFGDTPQVMTEPLLHYATVRGVPICTPIRVTIHVMVLLSRDQVLLQNA